MSPANESQREVRSSFRLDVHLNDVLTDAAPRAALPGNGELQSLPEPAFPEYPEGRVHSEDQYQHLNRGRAFRCWLYPYLRSRVRPGKLRPLISYLFTEYKCNIDCHYCWAFNNQVKGMTEDVAKRSIDWLHSVGCRVVAIMGGEPLLRPKFIAKLANYASKKDMFVYLPTNGRLMRPEVIDRIADAGVATVNLAVDCVDEKPGLPKALTPIRSYFEYLVERQRYHGYTCFLNINICRTNMEDVKELTEIAREHNVGTDYHICESPMLEQEHFQHGERNEVFLRPEDYPRVDDLLDWLAEKNRSGYKMINSIRHLADMKDFLRGRVGPWICRAGKNTTLIRTDGTLAPCFSMYSATHDWGTIEAPRFERRQLNQMKKSCSRYCLSTCQHNVGFAYSTRHFAWWLLRQARRRFRGVTGGMGG